MNYEGPYIISKGRVLFSGRDQAYLVCQLHDEVAVIRDVQDSIMISHGAFNDVQSRFNSLQSEFVKGGLEELADGLELIAFRATEETIEELNACISTSGRVAMLDQKLEELFNSDDLSAAPFGMMH